MIQYSLECIAFQLVFLIIYDLFLKRETFFQWNRVYLIGTYILSLIIPWVKIEALKTNVPQVFAGYPDFLWNRNNTTVVVTDLNETAFTISWEYGVLFLGMFIAALFFGYKLVQIQQLKQKGKLRYFKDFTQVIVANSTLAFSFFKSIFLGDKIIEKDYKNIVAHELVHIRQKHSYDLLFFELMRIVGWFNPLVYVYQNRVSELHEFIADAHVAKTNKRAQYQLLLSQVFQTQNISFINQFFNHSLIKKRIVMLQKTESKKVGQLKYLILAPMIMGMLFYTSCVQDSKEDLVDAESSLSERISELKAEIEAKEGSLTDEEKEQLILLIYKAYPKGIEGISGKNSIEYNKRVPYAVVDEVPVFPGCENETDPRSCFNEMIHKHIKKHFNYPQEAQELGIQGKVAVMFTIGKDGSIINVKTRGPHQLLENEVKRIISRLPQMTPGKHKGDLVNVPYSIPIMFKLK